MERSDDDELPETIPVSENGLPFCCPSAVTPVWNLHPRVFLPFEKVGQALSCPYCGQRYVLVETPV